MRQSSLARPHDGEYSGLDFMEDKRIKKLTTAVKAIGREDFHVDVPTQGDDSVATLAKAVADMGLRLEQKMAQLKKLMEITQEVNSGVMLEEILNHTYDSFRSLIPFDRMGLSLLEDNETLVRAWWARSEAPVIKIAKGFSARLKGSSLENIITTGQPRILNDLEAYLQEHPHSVSTRLILEEGIRSSLTCPLRAMYKPVGFLFFSSMQANTYQNIHTEVFLKIAAQLSTTVEKSIMYEKILALDAMKTRFLAMATHEIQNPLATSMEWIGFFLSEQLGPLTEAQKKGMGILHRVSHQMHHLVESFSQMAIIESSKLTITRQESNLGQLLQDCCESILSIAKAKSINIQWTLPKALPAVFLDPFKIERVINNLLSNAIKFSKPGTTITVSANQVAQSVEVFVRDQGQGIPQKELPKLFSFFGVTSTASSERGVGMGLATAKHIVELHGGRIWVISTIGKGSTFSFTLPLQAPSSPNKT